MVKLFVDSASDISKAEADALGIELIPIEIRFGDEEFLDGVNLLPRQFFEKLIESVEFPKTSQISPYTFEELFKGVEASGDEAVVIVLSSKLSGTYSSAVSASKKFKNIHIVDSLNACIGERLLVLYALRLIAEKKSASEVAELLNLAKTKIKLIARLDTLKYLRKGGRISAVTAFAGEMLSVKPVVGVVGGEVKLIGKAIGSKKANNLLNELVRKTKGIDFSMPFGVVYSGLDESVLNKYIDDSAHLWEDNVTKEQIPVYMIGSTIGTHVGPGAVGVAFFEK